MITLTGTEKQIAWAEKIRNDFIADSKKWTDWWEADLAGCIEDGNTDGAERTRERLENHASLTTEILETISRSGWWIDYGRTDCVTIHRKYSLCKRFPYGDDSNFT